jgi:lipoate-protein ligase A
VPETRGRRLACICVPTSSAVVIGSAQPVADFDGPSLRAAGLGLVRRRSGGGAVLVAPACQVWLDVFIPVGDELFQLDVGRSFHWLGEVFAQALAGVLEGAFSPPEIEVHRGGVVSSPWSKVLCFAGLGAGEVLVDGRKVVGMSQRRQRDGAWIHSMALLSGRAVELAELVSGGEERRAGARGALRQSGLVGAEHLAQPLTVALLERLG